MNKAIVFIDQVGGKDCAYGNFGGDVVVHPNRSMATNCLFILVISCIMLRSSLPFLDIDHDPPLIIIQDVVAYIILWPWKLTITCMGQVLNL
jgi:hypothetical protein